AICDRESKSMVIRIAQAAHIYSAASESKTNDMGADRRPDVFAASEFALLLAAPVWSGDSRRLRPCGVPDGARALGKSGNNLSLRGFGGVVSFLSAHAADDARRLRQCRGDFSRYHHDR